MVSEEQFLGSRLQALADRLCQGSLAPLMTTMLRSRKLSRKEREQLRHLIDRIWPRRE